MSDVHVKPVADLIDHTSDDCPCGPTTEPVPRSDGTVGWLHVHHSLDGREHPGPPQRKEYAVPDILDVQTTPTPNPDPQPEPEPTPDPDPEPGY